MYGFNPKEIKLFKTLNTPRKVQNFIDKIPINFEPTGDTFISPREVLLQNRAHCIEAACLAAAILRFHGYPPLIVDLTSKEGDEDHVIAVFKQHGHWGAISKTNHAVLRYREPIYKNIRELVMSYFHEYIQNATKKKTLRSYTNPINLNQFDTKGWTTDEKDLWYIVDKIFATKHLKILNRKQIATLRKADDIEVEAGEVIEWKKKLSPHPWIKKKT
ncbi:hypothetical protein EXS74_03975 [Candidatus Woesearchaeota archaeon]|nr:hypothetical protein [Candidatus Woesearchaeota archaeon]